MIPYSMPLWTIFTKWPAPLGPQWSQPCSAGVGWRRRRGPPCASTVPTPGASASKTGSQPGDRVVVATDHQAVAALQPEDAAAGAGVDVVDPLRP